MYICIFFEFTSRVQDRGTGFKFLVCLHIPGNKILILMCAGYLEYDARAIHPAWYDHPDKGPCRNCVDEIWEQNRVTFLASLDILWPISKQWETILHDRQKV